MKRNGIFYTISITFLITLIIVAILAFINELTKETVKLNDEIVLKRSILNSFHIGYSDKEDLINQYDSKIKEILIYDNDTKIIIYSTELSGKTNYAHKFIGIGLWGTITGILAVDENLSRITGIDIIAHNETPGLGGRIDEANFKEQFDNEKLINNTVNIVSAGEGDKDHENGEIDAISGATITSKLFNKIINDHLSYFKDYLELLNGQ